MARKTKNEDFGFIGEEGQIKIVKALLEDRKEITSYMGIVNQNLFTNESLREIVGIAKDYFNEHKTTPSYQLLEVLIKSKNRDEISENIIMDYFNTIKNIGIEEMDKYKEIAIRFFQQQASVKIKNKIEQMLKGDGFDKDEWFNILEEGKKILVNEEESDGIEFTDLMEEIALGSQQEERIPTGLKEVDNILGGGLEKGRMGLIVAPTGRGKTTLSTIIAQNAVLAGKKVLQIIFEDTEKAVQTKHYAKLLTVPSTSISENGLSDEQKAVLRRYTPVMKGNIIIKRMRNGFTTWDNIEMYVNHLEKERNFKPDVILVDYFDCIKHSTNTRLSQYEAASRCARKVEAYAGESNKAIWMFQQTNREAFKSESKEEIEKTLQGTITLAQVSSFNMFLIRSQDDMKDNLANLTVTKNRQGCVNSWDNIYLNNGTMEINFKNQMTYEF